MKMHWPSLPRKNVKMQTEPPFFSSCRTSSLPNRVKWVWKLRPRESSGHCREEEEREEEEVKPKREEKEEFKAFKK